MSSHYLFLPAGYPKQPLKNGIGRYMCQLKRVTIKFCKSLGTSRGVRDFIENDILDFTKANPEIVVYLKPRRHHSPVVVAEYLSGEKRYMNFHNFTRDETFKWINLMKTRSGMPLVRYRVNWHTELPSVQGVWTPFTNREPWLNIAEFPNEHLSVPRYVPTSATEELKKMYERQMQQEKQEEELKEQNLKLEVQHH